MRSTSLILFVTTGTVAAACIAEGPPTRAAAAQGTRSSAHAQARHAPPQPVAFGAGDPATTITFTVTNGALTLSVPASGTAATYTVGTITTTGTITATPTNITLSNSPQTVVTGSGGVGDNTASWNPTISVAVPASAVAGTYTGTLTQSVA